MAIPSTTFTKQEEVSAQWFIADATKGNNDRPMVLGHLAVRIAAILQGKHKPSYTPHTDDGDYVVVINAESLVLTGRKEDQKVYRYHTGFVGGLKEVPFKRMRDEKADKMLILAVKRMLPKNRLGRQMLDKLKVYKGAEHPHAAQKPQPLP